MILKDRIYGSFNISSPLIAALIESKPFQRLKNISQMGPPTTFYHIKNYSRYEHSIGVFLLLKHLGASDNEQIAGLLHDVSHTTFSHVIDWVVGTGKNENYQDDQHFNFIKKTEIVRILKMNGLIFRINKIKRSFWMFCLNSLIKIGLMTRLRKSGTQTPSFRKDTGENFILRETE